MIKVFLYDIAADAWGYYRNFTINHLINNIWQERLLEACCYPFDITGQNAIDCIELNQLCRIIVIHNCLNELGARGQRGTEQNIVELFHRMSYGSLLVVIDRDYYIHVNESLARIAQNIRAIDGHVICDSSEIFDTRNIHNQMPDILRRYLFTGHHGLVLANRIKYRCLIIQKQRNGAT